MVLERRDASARAAPWGTYLSAKIAWSTLFLTESRTFSGWFKQRETVAVAETPYKTAPAQDAKDLEPPTFEIEEDDNFTVTFNGRAALMLGYHTGNVTSNPQTAGAVTNQGLLGAGDDEDYWSISICGCPG